MTSVEEYIETGRYDSAIVRTLLKTSGVSAQVAANLIGVEYDNFRKKLSRGTFSYNEVMLIADRCGFKTDFKPKGTKM